jgi:thiamine pyridinylase
MHSMRIVKTIVITVLTVLLGIIVIDCSGASSFPTQKAEVVGVPDNQTLVLALYPYVPRVQQFQTAIEESWSRVHPNIPLQIITTDDQWDGGYTKDPSENMDVFVFDALYLNYFKAKNYMVPLQADTIDNIDDFLPYAINGVKIDDLYYGIPLLGCSNIFFYRKGDQPLEDARTLSDIYNALGQCTYTSKIPPDDRGMMVNMAGGTTNASNYIVAEHWVTQLFPVNLPWTINDVDQEAIDKLKRIMAMSSFYNSTSNDTNPYIRGVWFGQGFGRAYIDFTESLSTHA